jgi:dihydroorotate dehydrogenase
MFRLPAGACADQPPGLQQRRAGCLRGQRAACAQLRAAGGILGLNIGKNAATPIEDAVDDYLIGLDGVYPHADYVAVNISSPNTQNLRALQSDAALDALLARCRQRRQQLAASTADGADVREDRARPGRSPGRRDCRHLRDNGIDGVIATNTTVARDAVQGLPHADEAGGLSGAPVFEASNRVIRLLRAALGPGLPDHRRGRRDERAKTRSPRSPRVPTWCRSTPG